MIDDWTRVGPHTAVRAHVDEWCVDDERPVAVTVYYPNAGDDGDAPVVVFCHGLGSGRDEYSAIGSHLASHGIVSIHPEFDDAFDRVRATGALNGLTSHTWQADPDARQLFHRLLFDPRQWRSRARRAAAVIDAINVHAIPRMRHDSVTAAGHSFGAFTAQMLAGVRLFDDTLGIEEFRHPAVAAAALLSPQGSGARGLTVASWDTVSVPVLEITATHDFGPNGEGLEWRCEPFESVASRYKWLLVARGMTHRLGGIAVPLSAADDPGVVAAIAGSIAAFSAWVGGDLAAGQWLDSRPRSDIFDYT